MRNNRLEITNNITRPIIFTYIQTQIRVNIYMGTWFHMYVEITTQTHTYTYTHIHTHTHTYTHTHPHTHAVN